MIFLFDTKVRSVYYLSMQRFLESEFPSKVFMPGLGVKHATLHRWADLGYIHLPKVGTGKTLFLSGEQLLFAGCLGVLSKVAGNGKFMLRGLRDCVTYFRLGISDGSQRPMYAIFKYRDLDGAIDAEWELEESIAGNERHIVEAFGPAAPYCQIIYLTDLLRELIFKIDGRKV